MISLSKVSKLSNPTRANAAMRVLLSELDERELPRLPPPLKSVLAPGVEREGDALVLVKRGKVNPRPSAFPDTTGYEAFVNHVHIDDHLEGASPPNERLLAAYGVSFIRLLEAVLRSEARPTQIVLSVDEMTAGVRFFTRRPGVAYLADDLEGYRDEAILVLDVRPSRG